MSSFRGATHTTVDDSGLDDHFTRSDVGFDFGCRTKTFRSNGQYEPHTISYGNKCEEQDWTQVTTLPCEDRWSDSYKTEFPQNFEVSKMDDFETRLAKWKMLNLTRPSERNMDFPQYLEACEKYWEKHPLNRTAYNFAIQNEKHSFSFDWDMFLFCKDMTLRYKLKKQMPFAPPPTKMKMITKGPIEYRDPIQSLYESENDDPNKVITKDWSLTSADDRTTCAFTHGQYEGAYKLLKSRLLSRRSKTDLKKCSRWLKGSVWPNCYRLLSQIHLELNGYTEDFMRKFNESVESQLKEQKEELAYVVEKTEESEEEEYVSPPEEEEVVPEDVVVDVHMPTAFEQISSEVPKTEEPMEEDQKEVEVGPMECSYPSSCSNNLASKEQLTWRVQDPQDIVQMKTLPRTHWVRYRTIYGTRGREPLYPHEERQDWPFLPARVMRLNWYHCLMARRKLEEREAFRKEMALQWFIAREAAKSVLEQRTRTTQNLKQRGRRSTPQAQAAASADTITTEENITFVDQRETIVEEGVISQQLEVSHQQVAMSEETWSVANVLKRPYLQTPIGWTTAETTGTQVQSWVVPGGLVDGPQDYILRNFVFFRGHPKIRFQVNGTKFHCGRLLFVFIPRYEEKGFDGLRFSMNSLLSCPHVFLDASYNNTAILDLPFVHPNSYFNLSKTRAWQTLGRLYMFVFNQLRATSSASSNLTVNMWVSFDNPEAHQLTASHPLIWPKSPGTFTEPQAQALTALAAPALEGALKGAFGQVTRTATGFLPKNCDKPTDPVEITRFVPNTASSLAYGEGVDRSTRLGLDPAGFTLSDSVVMSTTNDMDLRSILAIPNLLKRFTWTTDQVPGTMLLNTYVCPNMCFDITPSTSGASDAFECTLLSYCSRAFKFWRGTLHYKIQVIASQMHSGRIGVCFIPGNKDITINVAKAMNNHIIDLEEACEHEFDVSFTSEKPWLRCDNLDPQITESETQENVYHTGFIYIYVVNRLVVPDNVSKTIEINLLVNAGKDFELAIPGDFYCCDGIGKLTATPKAQAQVETEITTRTEDQTAVGINKGSLTLGVTPHSSMGENCMNLKTLLRRYNKVVNYWNIQMKHSDRYLEFPNSPQISGVDRTYKGKFGQQFRTHLAHFSDLYTYWRGSLRYKIFFGTNFSTCAVNVFHVPGLYADFSWQDSVPQVDFQTWLRAMSNYGQSYIINENQKSIEFEIPFYTGFNMLECSNQNGNYNDRNTTGSVYVLVEPVSATPEASADGLVQYSLFQSAGDDFEMFYLRAPPVIQFQREKFRKAADSGADQPYSNWPRPIAVKDSTEKKDSGTKMDTPQAEGLTLDASSEPVKVETGLITELPQAQGWMDWFKPDVWKKAEKVMDKSLDVLGDVSKATNGIRYNLAGTSDDEEEEGSDEDEADNKDSFFGISSISSAFSGVVSNITASLSVFPSFLKWCQQGENKVTALDFLVNIADIVTAVTAFLKTDSLFIRICAIVSMVRAITDTAFNVCKDKMMKFVQTIYESCMNGFSMLKNKVGKKFNEPTVDENKPKAQGFCGALDAISITSLLTAVFTTVAAGVCLTKLPGTKDCMTLVKTVSEKLRVFNFATLAMANIPKFFGMVRDTMQCVLEWIVVRINPDWLPRLALIEGFEEVEKFVAFVDELDDPAITIQDRLNHDIDFRRKISHNVDLAKKYRIMILKGKLKTDGRLLMESTTKMLEIAKTAESHKDALPMRVDPFCFALTGKSGLGKSGMVTNCAMGMMDALGYPIHNRWCPVNCSDQYFSENYTHQSAIYFDDFSQFATEEQYSNFFNLKSNTAQPLNMAFRKGEFFTSDMIFMTTNVPYPSPNFLACNEALLRRRDALWEIEWATPELARRSANGENVRRFDGSHAKFRKLDSVNSGKFLTDWVSFKTMVRLATMDAWAFMKNQREKLYHDLTTANYLVEKPEPIHFKIPEKFRNIPVETDEEWNYFSVDPDSRGDIPVPSAQAATGPLGSDLDFINGDWTNRVIDYELELGARTEKTNGMTKTLDKDKMEVHGMLGPFDIDMLYPHVKWNGLCWNFVGVDLCSKMIYKDIIRACRKQNAYKVDLKWRYLPHQAFFDECAVVQYEQARTLDEPDKKQDQSPSLGDSSPSVVTDRKERTKSFLTRAKDKLKDMFKAFKDKIVEFCKSQSWVKVLIKTCVRVICVLLALCVFSDTAFGVVHKCVCYPLTSWFKFRCGICGKWPRLPGEGYQRTFILREWSRLYDDLPYKEGFITPIEEEVRIKRMKCIPTQERIQTGTAEAQGVYSSTDVRGQPLTKIVANAGTTGANQAVEEVMHKFGRATYEIQFLKPMVNMKCIAVGARTIMTTAHFFQFAKEGDEWQIFHDGVWMPLVFERSRLRTVEGKDIAFYDLPVRFHQHKSLSRHFITENELANFVKTDATLIKMDRLGTLIFDHGTAQMEQEVSYEFTTPLGVYPIRSVGVVKYRGMRTKPGDCGGALIASKVGRQPKALGFHVCATDVEGWSTLVTKELLDEYVPTSLGTPTPSAEACISNLVPPGHFGRVGTVSRDKIVIQSTKTDIIPTDIHGMISQPVSFPSVLHPNDPRLESRISPLRKGIDKYATISIPFDQSDVQIVTEELRNVVSSFRKPRPPQRLSMAQNINGIEELDGYLPLPMDTSPGLPYVHSRPTTEKGKGYLFDKELGIIKDKELEDRFEQRESLAKLGQRVESVWTDCLKDERRSLEKIRSGSTRVFTIPPVDFTLLVRKYTMDFCEAVRQNREESFCQVGMDPQSLEWTNLWHRLAKTSNLAVAGDFSRFDGTMPPELIHEVFCLIYYYLTGSTDPHYRPELWNVLMTIADEIIHTVQQAKDQIYMTHIGNPSGNPLTVIINSFINFYYIALAWLHLSRKFAPEYCSMYWFFVFVCFVCYGDDNLLSISALVIDWFNQETISAFLSNYGITYTNSEKSGITKWKNLSECTFLKNGFSPHPTFKHLMVPLMSKDTILELLNWTRVAPDQDELLMSNVQDCLRFMYFYGKEEFERLRTKIKDALETTGKRNRIMTFTDYDQWFLHKCGML